MPYVSLKIHETLIIVLSDLIIIVKKNFLFK